MNNTTLCAASIIIAAASVSDPRANGGEPVSSIPWSRTEQWTGPSADDGKKEIAPTEPEVPKPWSFSLGLPGWIPWQTGETGINGTTSHIKLGPNDIIPKLNMIAAARAEAHYERFGLMGEYSYMCLADGVGTPGLVKKLDVHLNQTVAELAFSYRVVQGERGWLDVFGGVRYTNLYQAVGVHPDSGAIQEASQGLVDTVVDRITQGVKTRLGALIQDKFTDKLASLKQPDPPLPDGPLGNALRQIVAKKVQELVQRRLAALQAAIQSGVQSRVDQAKARLAQDIASAVTEKLNTKVSRTDDWWDPFVGLRGRYYLTKAVYLTGRADIGGFGAGSELAWQVNAGIGLQVTRYIYSETTYRLYDVDYHHSGLKYDLLTHGIELTTGITF